MTELSRDSFLSPQVWTNLCSQCLEELCCAVCFGSSPSALPILSWWPLCCPACGFIHADPSPCLWSSCLRKFLPFSPRHFVLRPSWLQYCSWVQTPQRRKYLISSQFRQKERSHFYQLTSKPCCSPGTKAHKLSIAKAFRITELVYLSDRVLSMAESISLPALQPSV